MGLGGIAWVKTLLRTDPRFKGCMHDVDGGRRERGFDVVMVELMLRKRALVKGCQTLGQYARRWITLAEEQLLRFPDAETMVFLFDDETNVPQAKGETQKSRRRNVLTAEEQLLLGPYRYLCNNNPREFDARVNALFGAEAAARAKAGRTKMSPFEIFAEKHMATSALREDEFEFATRCIAAANFARLAADPAEGKPACRIIVDRGVWRPSFERHIETDAAHGGEEPWHSVAGSFPSAEARTLQGDPAARLRLRLAALDQLSEEARGAWKDRKDFAECVNRFERAVYMVRLGMLDHEARLGADDVLAGAFREAVEQAEALGAEEREFASRPVVQPLSPANAGARDARYKVLHERMDYLRGYLASSANDGGSDGGSDGGGDGGGDGGAAKTRVEEEARRNKAERAWLLIDETGVRRLGAMEGAHLVGEADLKIPRYARVFAGRNVFVVCHDSDLIPILLMVVKDWIPRPVPGREEGRRVPGRLWLDITTASDLKKKPVPAGILDVPEAWRAIHRWFADEYPAVRNPVEVFCLLLVLMGTDYVKNPPGMAAKTLKKGFDRLASRMLPRIVATDGLIGGSLTPPRSSPPVMKSVVGEEADAEVVRLLQRNVFAGSVYAPRGRTVAELTPPGRRCRYIAVNEPQLARYLSELYCEVGPKNQERWPPTEWWRAQARRVIWQMGYWYGGDTAAGRVCDDEMLSVSGDGTWTVRSLYGWEWRPVAPGAVYPAHHDGSMGVVESLERGRKRKVGCLGRQRPRDPPCESGPADAVVSLRTFKRVRRERSAAYLQWLRGAG